MQLLDYYPYGSVRIDEHLNNGYQNQYKFTGKELDDGTDLYYYGARYYSSELGRFMSKDPWAGNMTDPQSFNKYSYVMNNPVKYVDPTGEEPVSITIIAAAALAAYLVVDSGITPGQLLDSSPYITGDLNDIYVGGGASHHLFSGDPVTPEDRVNAAFFAAAPYATARSLDVVGKVADNVATKVDNVINSIKNIPDFIVTPKGTAIPGNQSVMKDGFDAAGFPSEPTRAPGTKYTMPDGSNTRIMEPNGPNNRRAVFENSMNQPINVDTGKPAQGTTKQDRAAQSHVNQNP